MVLVPAEVVAQWATEEQLFEVNEVGTEVAASIIEWFASPERQKLVKDLLKNGVEPQEGPRPVSGKLKGQYYLRCSQAREGLTW